MTRTNTVLIVGMGYIGKPLACALAEQQYKVLGTYHSTPSLDLPLSIDTERIDISDFIHTPMTSCKPHWAQADTWVCLLPPSCSIDYVKGIQAWVALAQYHGISHVVYSSSSSVFSAKEGEIDELASVSPQTESASKIVQVEQCLLNSTIPHVTILRFAGLFDDERHPVYRLSTKDKIANGQEAVNMTHRSDAVAALCHAIHNPSGKRIRHIVSVEHPSKEQFYTVEAKRLGVTLPPFEYGDIQGKKIITSYQDFPIPHIHLSDK